MMETVLQVLERDPVAPREFVPGLPRELETICLKCLEKMPEDRYPAAQDLANDLNRFLQGDVVRRPCARRYAGVITACAPTCRSYPIGLCGPAVWSRTSTTGCALFFLRRQLGKDYLTLLQFFLNHRRYLRSEDPNRVGKSPAELLTGEPHAHWLELLGYTRFSRN